MLKVQTFRLNEIWSVDLAYLNKTTDLFCRGRPELLCLGSKIDKKDCIRLYKCVAKNHGSPLRARENTFEQKSSKRHFVGAIQKQSLDLKKHGLIRAEGLPVSFVKSAEKMIPTQFDT